MDKFAHAEVLLGLYTKIASHLPECMQLVKFLIRPMNSSNRKNYFALISTGFYLLFMLSFQAVTSEVSQFLPLLVKQEWLCAVSDFALMIVILHYILSMNALND